LRRCKRFPSLRYSLWIRVLGRGRSWADEDRDEYLPVSYFDAIYLIDLCEPLLEVARKRFAARGWKNVHVLCQDASRFVLPEWESGQLDPRGSLTAVTLSYSLSMVSAPAPRLGDSVGERRDEVLMKQIPPFYQLLDRCDQVLDPQRGLMGVVDFYTSRDLGNKEKVSADATRRDALQVVSLELRADGPRPSAQRARGSRGSPNGSGSAGSRWTTSISTPRDAVSSTLLHWRTDSPS
jgi:hypothetical protein